MARLHPLQKMLAPVLAPASLLYGAAGAAKRMLSHAGIPAPAALPAPCVSVGNISWGGTGKTPVIDMLLGWAEAHGVRAAVLTRGYGSRPPRLPYRVTAASPPSECGDEPLMLKRRHPEAEVVVDPVRKRGGMSLAADPPGLYLLDDGFQHVAVRRDTNLVLLDIEDVFAEPRPGANKSNWNHVIPFGSWREPAQALADADAFLVKTEPDGWKDLVPCLKRRLAGTPRPVFAFRMKASGTAPVSPAASGCRPPEGRYAFVCGIGAPGQARRTAAEFMGRPPDLEIDLPDHCDYLKEKKRINACGLPVLCTAKDAVKLADLDVPCWSLEASAEFHASLSAGDLAAASGAASGTAPDFETWWNERWQNLASART